MIALTFPYLVLKSFSHGALILGFLYTAASIGTALLGLFFGFLTDVWGRKETLLVVAVLIPLSCLFVLLSHTLFPLFAAAALGGYSATGSLAGGGVGGAAQPIQSAILADLTTPENRTKYYSVFTFISGILAALGTLLAKLFPMVRPLFNFLGFPFIFLNLRGSTKRIPMSDINMAAKKAP